MNHEQVGLAILSPAPHFRYKSSNVLTPIGIERMTHVGDSLSQLEVPPGGIAVLTPDRDWGSNVSAEHLARQLGVPVMDPNSSDLSIALDSKNYDRVGAYHILERVGERAPLVVAVVPPFAAWSLSGEVAEQRGVMGFERHTLIPGHGVLFDYRTSPPTSTPIPFS